MRTEWKKYKAGPFTFQSFSGLQKLQTLPEDPEGSVFFGMQSQFYTAFIKIIPSKPEEQMPYDNPVTIIRSLREYLSEEQGILKVDCGKNDAGVEYVYTLIKTVHAEEGIQYAITMDLKKKEHSCTIQAFFTETGMTGIREAMMLEDAIKNHMVKEDMTGWKKDPYDKTYAKGEIMNLSELETMDQYFPGHVLTDARRFLKRLIQSLR